MQSRDALYLALSAALTSAACGAERDDETCKEERERASIVDAGARDARHLADVEVVQETGAPNDAQTVDASIDAEPDAFLSPRRPFLAGATLRTSKATVRADWLATKGRNSSTSLDATTQGLLARAWLQDALEEHASVAAFARLSLHLLSFGAPPDLIAASQRASIDEIEHARGCFSLAERYSGNVEGPGPLRVHDTIKNLFLEDLAFLCAQEGCVGETLGAHMARAQLEGARDTETRRLLQRLVVDEARHAELSWRIAGWAVRIGGRPVLHAIETGVAEATARTLALPLRNYEGVDMDALRAHGRMTCHAAREEARRGVETIVKPCLKDLRKVISRLEQATGATA